MNKDFTLYPEALELKQLGFDEPCFGVFINENFHLIFSNHQLDTIVLAPTYSQAFRWFDENTSFQGFVIPSIKEGHFDWKILNLDTEEEIQCEEYFQTRLEAELASLRKLIEIVKEKDENS